MKAVFFILLLLPLLAGAQQVVLLDRNLRSPITVSQQPEGARLDWNKFPVYDSDIDSLLVMVNWFIDKMDEQWEAPGQSFIKTVGHSRFVAQASTQGKMPVYSLQLITRTGDSGYTMELINNKDGHRKRQQRLSVFLDYLRNNQFLVKSPR